MAHACPETALGTDTSTAELLAVEWHREEGVHLVELSLRVTDQPLTRRIKVDGQPIDARVEHWTPLTLAHWLKGVGLLFGGASKFVVGAARDTETGETAIIPFGSLKSVQVSQGADFDQNAPFDVTLTLACLHPPVPFEGALTTFEPHHGVAKVGDHWVRLIDNEAPDRFDPYGQAYGDYFADLWYTVSFLHGPLEDGEFLTEDDPMPHERMVMYNPAEGFHVIWPRASLASLLPREQQGPTKAQTGTLYQYVLASYDQLQPTTTLDQLVGRPVEIAIMGDRSLVPPYSPYSEYRAVVEFRSGRHYDPKRNTTGLLGDLALREPPTTTSWPSVHASTATGSRHWQAARTQKAQAAPAPAASLPTAPIEDSASAPGPEAPRGHWLWLVLVGGVFFAAGGWAGRRHAGTGR